MLASGPEPPGAGTLTVAAWAAHRAGDEDAEHRFASELLARADADGDAGQRLEVIRSVLVRGHPGETCELIEPYLREHPDDEVAAEIYADAVARAYAEAEPGDRERAALARYADRSAIDALRAGIDSFLERTHWGESVQRLAAAQRAELEQDYWQPAERDAFDALAYELAIRLPADGEDAPELPQAGDRTDGPTDPEETALRAFAADEQVPKVLARQAWRGRTTRTTGSGSCRILSPGQGYGAPTWLRAHASTLSSRRRRSTARRRGPCGWARWCRWTGSGAAPVAASCSAR